MFFKGTELFMISCTGELEFHERMLCLTQSSNSWKFVSIPNIVTHANLVFEHILFVGSCMANNTNQCKLYHAIGVLVFQKQADHTVWNKNFLLILCQVKSILLGQRLERYGNKTPFWRYVVPLFNKVSKFFPGDFTSLCLLEALYYTLIHI